MVARQADFAPGQRFIPIHRRHEKIDSRPERGEDTKVEFGLGESTALEVEYGEESRFVEIPQLVVRVEVTMDEDGVSRGRELVVDPIAPVTHRRPLGAPRSSS